MYDACNIDRLTRIFADISDFSGFDCESVLPPISVKHHFGGESRNPPIIGTSHTVRVVTSM